MQPSAPLPPMLLLVDDEPLVRQALYRYLSRLLVNEHIEVVAMENPSDALLECTQRDVRIAITDYLLPNMSGIELIRRMKQHSPRTAFVLMSGFASDTITPGVQDIGTVAFLTKPFHNRELGALVRKLLGLPQS
jgi:two-component system response regulator YesN